MNEGETELRSESAPSAVPHPTVLRGRLLTLVPMAEEHIDPLLAISKATPEEYVYTSVPVTDEQAEAYFDRAFAEREAGFAYPFTALDAHSGDVIGATRLADIRWRHRNCELGYTWFPPSLHRSGVNIESKLLMLGLAFDTLSFVRVQIHTHVSNIRSQRAIEALGAVREGVLRRHMITKDGFVRDTVVYSVIDFDWPDVRYRLLERLRKRGVDTSG